MLGFGLAAGVALRPRIHGFVQSYLKKEPSAMNKTDDCDPCHLKNAIDWVFSQDYPVLRAADPKRRNLIGAFEPGT